MVKGLTTFAAYYAGDEVHYVLIGGVATRYVLEDACLQASATRDLDEVTAAQLRDLRIEEAPDDIWARLRAVYGGQA